MDYIPEKMRRAAAQVMAAVAMLSVFAALAAPIKAEAAQRRTFALGADISWDTYLQDEGIEVRDQEGKPKTSHELTKEYGLDAVRLRVFVDPTALGGYCQGSAYAYCGKDDIARQARWATEQGQRLLIDFHLSDNWCDPANQKTPSAWQTAASIDQLKALATAHVEEVLQKLKEDGAEVAWVQIGNETRTGFMKEWCAIAKGDAKNFCTVFNAAAEAAKAIYPEAKTILMLDNGADYSKIAYTLDQVKGGLKYDLLGISMYPVSEGRTEDWKQSADNCLEVIRRVWQNYGKRTLVCETGMPSHWTSTISTPEWNEEADRLHAQKCSKDVAEYTNYFANKLIETGLCDGMFYWEPTIHELTKSNNSLGYAYDMGALDAEHKANGYFGTIAAIARRLDSTAAAGGQAGGATTETGTWYLTGVLTTDRDDDWKLKEENQLEPTPEEGVYVLKGYTNEAMDQMQITNSDWSQKYGSEDNRMDKTNERMPTGRGGASAVNLPKGTYNITFDSRKGEVMFEPTTLGSLYLITDTENWTLNQARKFEKEDASGDKLVLKGCRVEEPFAFYVGDSLGNRYVWKKDIAQADTPVPTTVEGPEGTTGTMWCALTEAGTFDIVLDKTNGTIALKTAKEQGSKAPIVRQDEGETSQEPQYYTMSGQRATAHTRGTLIERRGRMTVKRRMTE